MARMYAKRKGRASSRRPPTKKNPDWVSLETGEIEKIVGELAVSGLNSAQIGLKLRDTYGVPNVRLATGKTIPQIMKEKGMKFELPEDVVALMKKAAKLQAHLKTNPSDLSNKRALDLTESKIRRLTRYYKREGTIPREWNYSSKSVDILSR